MSIAAPSMSTARCHKTKASCHGCFLATVSRPDRQGIFIADRHLTAVEPDIIALGFQELVELSPQQIVSVYLNGPIFGKPDIGCVRRWLPTQKK